MSFLADEFKKLAEDKSWPVETDSPDTLALCKGRLAKLALIVVKEMKNQYWAAGEHSNVVLKRSGISPDHYAEVKRRVEEAERG